MPAQRGLPVLAILLTTLLGAETVVAEEAVSLDLANRGPAALRCQWQLAHWMTAAPLTLQPQTSGKLDIWRDQAGALFLRQPGEARPFHIEALFCGPDEAFGQQRLQIDLAPLRRSTSESLSLDCKVKAAASCLTKP